MKFLRPVLAILVCSLAGVFVWQIGWLLSLPRLGMRIEDTPFGQMGGWLFLTAMGWVYATALTVAVGLPIGFALAWFIKRSRRESFFAYLIVGAAASFLFAMALPRREEFWPSITVTGALLGMCYWRLVRRPSLRCEI